MEPVGVAESLIEARSQHNLISQRGHGSVDPMSSCRHLEPLSANVSRFRSWCLRVLVESFVIAAPNDGIVPGVISAPSILTPGPLRFELELARVVAHDPHVGLRETIRRFSLDIECERDLGAWCPVQLH